MLTDAKKKLRVVRADGYCFLASQTYAGKDGGRRKARISVRECEISKEKHPREMEAKVARRTEGGGGPNARLAQQQFLPLVATDGSSPSARRNNERTKMRRRDVPRDDESSLTSRYENPVNLSTANNMANRGDKGTGSEEV